MNFTIEERSGVSVIVWPKSCRPANEVEKELWDTIALYRSFLTEHGQLKAFEAWATTRGWGNE